MSRGEAFSKDGGVLTGDPKGLLLCCGENEGSYQNWLVVWVKNIGTTSYSLILYRNFRPTKKCY